MRLSETPIIRECENSYSVEGPHIVVINLKGTAMNSFYFCVLLLSAVCGSEVSLKDTTKDGSTQVNVTETERANKETVSINVQRVQIDRDQNGGFEDARILKVSTRFSS